MTAPFAVAVTIRIVTVYVPGAIAAVFGATITVIGLAFPVWLRVSQGGGMDPAGTPARETATVNSGKVAVKGFGAGAAPFWSALKLSAPGLIEGEPPAPAAGPV